MKNLSRIVCFILAAVMLLSLAACGATPKEDTQEPEEAATHIVTDNSGNKVEVPTEINRIAVCSPWPLPSVLSVFFDSADKIVGIPPVCMAAAKNGLLGELYPEILGAETGFTDGTTVNMEELAKLQPDVVFYSSANPEIGQQLSEAGFAAVAISPSKWGFDCIETLNSWIELLSEMFPDNDRAEAVKDYSTKIYDMVQERVKDIPDEEKQDVFFLFQYSETTLLTPTGKSFGEWWAEAINARNVAAEIEADNSAPVNMEQIYTWNPDIIFITNFTTAGPDDLYGNSVPGYDWSGISAVQQKQVYKMPLGSYRSYTAGADTPITLLWLAKTVYPELFTDIDLVSEAKTYYAEVFGVELTDAQAESIFNPSSAAGTIS